MGASIVTVLSALAIATQAPLLPESYTLICRVDQSVGFNWSGGGWVTARFKSNEYMVTKQASNSCPALKADDDFAVDGFVAKSACINLRELGSRYYPYSSAKCREFYVNKSGQWQTSITCYDSELVAEFDPDGWFHLAHIHGSLEAAPKNNYKDSQFVEVGKCSRAAT